MDDHAQICNLLYRYAELINTGQFDAVGALFRYGRVRVDGNPNVYEGEHAVANMYRSTVNASAGGPDSLLFTSNTQIELNGDQAVVKSYFCALHQRPGQIVPIVAGRYKDALERLDGQWWFRERRMTVDLLGDLGEHLHGAIDDYMPDRRSAT